MTDSFHLTCIAELKGHDDRVWHAAWNPARPLLATCSADKTVRIYAYSQTDNTLKFKHIHTLPTGHSKAIRALAWNPAGTSLACGSFDSTVSIWEQDGEDWECVATLEGPESEIKSLAYSSEGNLLATCSRDKSVWIWEVPPDNEHETVSVLMGQHAQDIKCVCWHPQEEILASGSYDDLIKLYVDDPSDDWYDYATLKGHNSTVWSLAFSRHGECLASASDDKSLKLWLPSTSQGVHGNWDCALTLQGHSRSVYSTSWSKENRKSESSLGWLASTGSDGVVNVWDITKSSSKAPSLLSASPVLTYKGSHGEYDTNAVSFCPRNGFESFLVTVGDDALAKVWQIHSAVI